MEKETYEVGGFKEALELFNYGVDLRLEEEQEIELQTRMSEAYGIEK